MLRVCLVCIKLAVLGGQSMPSLIHQIKQQFMIPQRMKVMNGIVRIVDSKSKELQLLTIPL